MRIIFQLLAASIVLIFVGDTLRSFFNLNAEIGFTPKAIFALVLWWGTIFGVAFAWLVLRKRKDRQKLA